MGRTNGDDGRQISARVVSALWQADERKSGGVGDFAPRDFTRARYMRISFQYGPCG